VVHIPEHIPSTLAVYLTDGASLFERAASFVGTDFHAHHFWTKYMEFEERNNDTARLIALLERVQHYPQWASVRYYERYRTFLSSHTPLEEVTTAETFNRVKAEVAAENQGLPEKTELEIDRAIRHKLDVIYYELQAINHAEVSKRWAFEEHIKRPYFHVTDVEESELANWRKYLDFEESQGDFKRIVDLYERCLTVCALYEEFWLRYARWMFAQGKNESARVIYLRASCIFVPIAHPTVRLHWARFEEKVGGSIQKARDIHHAILENLPDSIETMISLAGLERRHEGVESAVQCLQTLINQRGMPIAAKLTVEQARLLWQCGKEVEKARALFMQRVKQFSGSKDFWAGFLKFETSQVLRQDYESYTHVKKAYELMREQGGFSASDLKDLSKEYLEYLLSRGGSEAAEEYMRLDRELNGYV
jgi:pre-mRNA-processing factor 39